MRKTSHIVNEITKAFFYIIFERDNTLSHDPTTVIGKITVEDNCSDAEAIALIKKSCGYDDIIEKNSSYEFENVVKVSEQKQLKPALKSWLFGH